MLKLPNEVDVLDDFCSVFKEDLEDLLDLADEVLDIEGLERMEHVFVELVTASSEGSERAVAVTTLLEGEHWEGELQRDGWDN